MPTYTYTGPETAYFPQLGRTLAPGDSTELDANPGDGRWTPPDAPPVDPAPGPPLSPTVPIDPSNPPGPGATPAAGAVRTGFHPDNQKEVPDA